MRTRRRGRKIYTYRVKNRRVFSRYHPMRSAIGTAAMVVLLLFLGLVGYNIIGPLTARLRQEASTPTTTPDPYDPSDYTVPATTTTVTTTITTSTTPMVTETTEPPVVVPLQRAQYLNPNAVSDLTRLQSAVTAAAEAGCTAVVVPLRLSGGALQYQSAVPQALLCAATSNELPALSEITSTIAGSGCIPIARIETLSDNLLPIVDAETGFSNLATGGLWLDDVLESGGKPWLSPFSAGACDYLSALVTEIAQAGFQYVICGGVSYPNFYDSDLAVLDPQLSDAARRQAGLIACLNTLSEAGGAVTAFEFDLSEALAGTVEALAPQELSLRTAVVILDFHAFESAFFYGGERYDVSKLADRDKTLLLLQIAQELVGNMKLIPCIRSDNLDDTQLQSVISAVEEAGYTQLYLQ